MSHQQRQILRPVAQRGHLQRHHIEAIVKVFAKAAIANPGRQIGVGRGHHANVAFHRPRTADALKLALLQHPQQLGLQIEGKVANLVQKERSGLRLLKTPDAILAGPRESPFHMSEELRLQQLPRDGVAVNSHKRHRRPSTRQVQRAGCHLLARTGLARDQNRRATGTHQPNQIRDFRHGRPVAYQALAPGLGRRLHPRARGKGDLPLQLCRADRLRQHPGRAQAQEPAGLIEQSSRRVGLNQADHRQLTILGQQVLQQRLRCLKTTHDSDVEILERQLFDSEAGIIMVNCG